jgi:DNA gyrase/topoisomerase IV subunit B
VQQGKKKFYAYDEGERELVIDRLIEARTGKKKADADETAEALAEEGTVVVAEDETVEEGSPETEVVGAGDDEEEAPVTDEERERLKTAGVTAIQRYKGLGEMNADQLWETTMDPANRVLLKVNVEDAEKADAIFNKLMGEEVLLRKNFISSKATTLSDHDLDI